MHGSKGHISSAHMKMTCKCTFPNCDKVFAFPEGRNRHYNSQHKKRYPCELCNKVFIRNFDKEKHKCTHRRSPDFSFKQPSQYNFDADTLVEERGT